MEFWLISISLQFFHRLIIGLAIKKSNFPDRHRSCMSDPWASQLHPITLLSSCPTGFLSVQQILHTYFSPGHCSYAFYLCSAFLILHFQFVLQESAPKSLVLENPLVFSLPYFPHSLHCICSDFWYLWQSHILLCNVITVTFTSQFHEDKGSHYLLLFYSILTSCLIDARWINESMNNIVSRLWRNEARQFMELFLYERVPFFSRNTPQWIFCGWF